MRYLKKQDRWQIKDLVSGKVYDTVEGKGAADRRFVEVQKEHPNRKLWLKMEPK
jgi:hypothetical protein